MTQLAIGIPDDRVADGLEGAEVQVDGLAAGLEGGGKLVYRRPVALRQNA